MPRRLRSLLPLLALLVLPLAAQSHVPLPPGASAQLPPGAHTPEKKVNTSTGKTPGTTQGAAAASGATNPMPSVKVTIDAPPELRAMLASKIKESMRYAPGVDLVAINAMGDPGRVASGWEIVMVAMESEANSSKVHRFAVATSYLQRLPYVDSRVVAKVKLKPCTTPAELAKLREQHALVFNSMKVSEADINDLSKVCAEVIKDFNQYCIVPEKAYQKSLAAPAPKN